MNKSGAEFSACKKFRYALWRVWDETKPLVMFVGLNPSTANEISDDPTIRSICRIAMANGFGGVYMVNCFPFISTDPAKLVIGDGYSENLEWLRKIGSMCSEVIFAWGNFKVVKDTEMDIEMTSMFPDAKCLSMNKNGSPKHPLYCRSDSVFIDYKFSENTK